MTDECGKCGQCCKHLIISEEAHATLQLGHFGKGDFQFAKEHFTYIGTVKDICPELVSTRLFRNNLRSHVYSCDLLTDDNLCSVHDSKPQVCSGYPFYNGNYKHSIPWAYSGCVYELLSHRLTLVSLLIRMRDNLSADDLSDLVKNIKEVVCG